MSQEDRERWRNSQEIFVMDRDGSGVKQLTANQVRDCCARWSADGKLIYFVSDREGLPHIYAMKKDGSAVRKVADGSIVREPIISRDGKYFAYTKEVNKSWGLYLYEIKSGTERLLIGG
jgi:TolB protein